MVHTRGQKKQEPAKSPGNRRVRFQAEIATPPLLSRSPPKKRESTSSLTQDKLKEHGAEIELQATVNDRLKEARLFLADEDLNFHKDFEAKVQEIDDLLRRLSEKEIPCDVQLYEEVKLMMKVHHDRMDTQSGMLVPFNEPKNLPFSRRLPTEDPIQKAMAALAYRKDDHPPFTLKTNSDDTEFWKAINGKDKQGEILRLKQVQACLSSLTEPSSTIKQLPEEDFANRASNRGKQATALQIALQSFARNHEQHFGDKLENRVIDTPKVDVIAPKEPVLSSIGNESINRVAEQIRRRKRKSFGAFDKIWAIDIRRQVDTHRTRK
jgi:hypothetical protein